VDILNTHFYTVPKNREVSKINANAGRM